MKSIPKMFDGESFETYVARLKADGYSEDQKELESYATEAWYERREELRRIERETKAGN